MKIKKDLLRSLVIEEFPSIKLKVFCFDDNNDELGVHEKIIAVKTPDIDLIGVPKACKIGEIVKFRIKIKNTLNIPLSKVRFIQDIDGQEERKIKI